MDSWGSRENLDENQAVQSLRKALLYQNFRLVEYVSSRSGKLRSGRRKRFRRETQETLTSRGMIRLEVVKILSIYIPRVTV
jgi:hypothetical protein